MLHIVHGKCNATTMANIILFSVLCATFLIQGFTQTAAEETKCQNDKVVFCYYASWSIYRPKFGAFGVENIDPSLCTHMVYGFAGLNLDGVIFSLDPQSDLPEAGVHQQFYKFNHLRDKNPCLKTLLSIGGWNEGSEKYSIMVETPDSRKKFIEHLLRFLVYYGFDGIDVDWEYPTQRGGIKADKANFVLLLKELKARLSVRGKLVCTAVGASLDVLDQGYDVKGIADNVDYVLLMAYDYNRPDTTSFLAPLKRKSGDANAGSVAESVEKWLSLGCPPSKLVLGVVSSGRSYKLKNPSEKPEENGIGLPVEGPGSAGPYTNIDGFFAFYEICDMIHEDKDWFVESNLPEYASSYATKGDQWITYEDAATVTTKTEYAMEKKLAGVMIYSIDTDDFHGFCSFDENSLQRAIIKGLEL